MKKLAVILCLTALTTGAFAQGLVNFFNGATSTISYNTGTNVSVLPSGAAGTYWFALLTAPSGTTDPTAFTFSGYYGTNQAAAGRFTGGGSLGVAGWAAGTTRAVLVAGWGGLGNDMGPVWNPEWLTGVYPNATRGYFGFGQTLGTGPAGGTDPVTGGSFPPLNLFGGVSGLQTGFVLQPIPEPATMALAGLGAAALLIFRRRK